MKKASKGQVFSADFLVGVIVVLFILTTVQVYHSRVIDDINEEERLIFQEALASRTDTLLLFEGEPENWDSESVKVLGFSTGTPNELNETKLEEYFSMEDEEAEDLLGFYGREFFLSVENEEGEVLTSGDVEFSRGDRNWEHAEDIYTVERKVSLGNRKGNANLRLVVW